MDQTSSSSTLSANTLHCALELSKKSWLLAIQFPDREQPSLYPIGGRDTEKLMAKLAGARDCWAKVSGALLPVIMLCYEVGYDGFWLARFLKARGIECLVIDPGSLQVNRRGRWVKTDRVDVKVLLRTLIAWCRGERHVWSLVRVPSIDVPIQNLSSRQARDRRWSSLAAPTRLRDRTGDPETCPLHANLSDRSRQAVIDAGQSDLGAEAQMARSAATVGLGAKTAIVI